MNVNTEAFGIESIVVRTHSAAVAVRQLISTATLFAAGNLIPCLTVEISCQLREGARRERLGPPGRAEGHLG